MSRWILCVWVSGVFVMKGIVFFGGDLPTRGLRHAHTYTRNCASLSQASVCAKDPTPRTWLTVEKDLCWRPLINSRRGRILKSDAWLKRLHPRTFSGG